MKDGVSKREQTDTSVENTGSRMKRQVQGRKTSPGKKGSNSRSPHHDKAKGGKSQKGSTSPSRKYQGGYLDAIADQ